MKLLPSESNSQMKITNIQVLKYWVDAKLKTFLIKSSLNKYKNMLNR